MSAPTDTEILQQLGYFSDTTTFLSLTLTDDEVAVVQAACFAAPIPHDGRTETTITHILSEWLATQKDTRHDCDQF